MPSFGVVQHRTEVWAYTVSIEAKDEDEARRLVEAGEGADDTDPEHIDTLYSDIVEVQ